MSGVPVIRSHALTKRFGRVVAVDGIDLDVREGDRYGFLGPNGSGKTTTVRMLLGLVFATSGTAEVLGHRVPGRVAAALPDIGAVVEGPAAYAHLSARTNLALIDASGPPGRAGRRTRRRRIDAVLETVGLADVGRRPVRAYSLGMRQRLGLAAALLRAPRLLVLDEPTNGLDPRGIHDVRELLARLNAAGTTVFMSSHLLAEVDRLCTRVGVMDAGRLVLQDDLGALRGPTGRVLVRVDDPVTAVRALDGHVVDRDGSRLVTERSSVADVVAALVRVGVRVDEATREHRTLEQTVLAVTGHGSDRVDRATGPNRPLAERSPS